MHTECIRCIWHGTHRNLLSGHCLMPDGSFEFRPLINVFFCVWETQTNLLNWKQNNTTDYLWKLSCNSHQIASLNRLVTLYEQKKTTSRLHTFQPTSLTSFLGPSRTPNINYSAACKNCNLFPLLQQPSGTAGCCCCCCTNFPTLDEWKVHFCTLWQWSAQKNEANRRLPYD